MPAGRWARQMAGTVCRPESAIAIAEDGIKGGEHFAHDREDRDLRLLARGNEATVEGAQRRVEPDRGQGRHVEGIADAEATAIDVALPAEPAAICLYIARLLKTPIIGTSVE